MGLYLDNSEKERLLLTKNISIDRICLISAPSSSTVHGIGNRSLFDKIAYKWIYGDTRDYIDKMRFVGVRGTEYIYGKSKDRNIYNGGCWYDHEAAISEFGSVGDSIKNGRKNIIRYTIKSIVVSLKPKPSSKYLNIILHIDIILN